MRNGRMHATAEQLCAVTTVCRALTDMPMKIVKAALQLVARRITGCLHLHPISVDLAPARDRLSGLCTGYARVTRSSNVPQCS